MSEFPKALSKLPKVRQRALLDTYPTEGWRLQSEMLHLRLTGVKVGQTTCKERGFGVIVKYKKPEGGTFKGFWVWDDLQWRPVYVGLAPEPKPAKPAGARPSYEFF